LNGDACPLSKCFGWYLVDVVRCDVGCHNLGIDLTNAGHNGSNNDNRSTNLKTSNDCEDEHTDGDNEEACNIIDDNEDVEDDDTDWPGTIWDGYRVGDNLGQCDLNENLNPIEYDSNGDCIFTGVFP
jgi:hypothetical protein